MTHPDHNSAQGVLELQPPRIPPTRPQGKKALAMLEAAGSRGVGAGDFANAYLLAYSQEIGRLKARGYKIVSRIEHDANTARYWLAEYYRPETEA